MRERPLFAAAAIYAALALVVFGQGLIPGRLPMATDHLWQAAPWSGNAPPGVAELGSNFELHDSITQFQPFLIETRRTLPHIPLWDPYVMGGRPFLANSQSAVFSPFSLPAYVLPFWHSLALIEMLKVFVAALGAFVFGRSLGMRFVGALAAGTIFGFSQAMVTWVSWPHTSSWALLPWLLVLVDRLLHRPDVPVVAGLAVLVALAYLGGHPESSFDVIAAAVAWFVFRLLQHGVTWRFTRARVLAFGMALVAGTCLAAVTLVPFLELLRSSWDYDARGLLPERPLGTRYLKALFMPDWWGRPTQRAVAPFQVLPVYGHSFYAGALSLLLAAGAVVTRPRAVRLAFAAAAVVGILAIAGVEPVFGAVAALRGPAKVDKLYFFVVFCIAMLAGFGVDDLARRVPTMSRRWLGAAALIFLIPVVVALADGAFSLKRLGGALGVAAGLTAGEPAHPATAAETAELHMGALLLWVALAGLGFGLVWLRLRGRLGPTLFASLAVALIALDLLKVDTGFNPAVPAAQALQPDTPGLRYLQSRRPARFVGIDGANLLGLSSLVPNLALRYRLYDARGYDFPAERRFARLWSDNVAPVLPEPRFFFPAPTPRALHALGLLGVTDVLQDARGDPLTTRGLRLAYSGPDRAHLFERVRAAARFRSGCAASGLR